MDSDGKNDEPKKTQRKRDKAQRQRWSKQKQTMLKTVKVIGLYHTAEIDKETWSQVRDARERILRTPGANECSYAYSMTNWRVAEIQVILYMISQDWMHLQPSTSHTTIAYTMLNDTMYAMRMHLARISGDQYALQVPKPADPATFVDYVPLELALIANLADTPVAVSLQTVGHWFAHLTLIVATVIDLATFHRLEIAAAILPPSPKSRCDAQFEELSLLPFVTFREIDDFPRLLQRWSEMHMSYFVARNARFNRHEVESYMQRSWDAALVRQFVDN